MAEPLIQPPPSEARPPDRRFERLPHKDVLLRPPFTMQVLGRIGAGKTSLLWSMLSDLYRRYWDEVVIWSGSMDSREHWLGLAPKAQRRVAVVHDYDEESLSQYLRQLQLDQKERMDNGKQPLRIALIFDDMIGSGMSSRSKATALERLMLVCRHEYNATVIILSQALKALSPTMRANTLYWAIYPVATVDADKVVAEHANHVHPDVFKRMLASVHAQPHQFMLVCYKGPEAQRFRHGFSRVMDPTAFSLAGSKAPVHHAAAAQSTGSDSDEPASPGGRA